MPVGITDSLKIYKIRHNLLTHVVGPEAYEFCATCNLFKFGNNPWICNANMIRMLLWLTTNAGNKTQPEIAKTNYIEGKCAELPEMGK